MSVLCNGTGTNTEQICCSFLFLSFFFNDKLFRKRVVCVILLFLFSLYFLGKVFVSLKSSLVR